MPFNPAILSIGTWRALAMPYRVSPGATTIWPSGFAGPGACGAGVGGDADAGGASGFLSAAGGGPLGPTSVAGTKAGEPVAATITCRRGPVCGPITWKNCQTPAGPNWTALSSGPDHRLEALNVSTQKGVNA